MELYRHEWNVTNAKASIVLVHGTGEHHGRYQHVAAYLNRCGYTIKTGDLPGWGRSAGRKGHIDSFEDYVTAVAEWVRSAIAEKPAPDYPVFLFGHSLGGLVVTRYAQEYREADSLSGIILSSPCLRLKMNVPGWKRGIAAGLNQLWPTLRLASDIAPTQVTRDPQMQELYRHDPYNYSKVSVRWFTELLRTMEAAWQKRAQVHLPLLVVQAGADRLIDPVAVQQFVEETRSADKEFVVYPELYHEVLNEPEKELVLEKMAQWLSNKIS